MKPLPCLLITFITEIALKAQPNEDFPFTDKELSIIRDLIEKDSFLKNMYFNLKYEIYSRVMDISKHLRKHNQDVLSQHFPEYFI